MKEDIKQCCEYCANKGFGKRLAFGYRFREVEETYPKCNILDMELKDTKNKICDNYSPNDEYFKKLAHNEKLKSVNFREV